MTQSRTEGQQKRAGITVNSTSEKYGRREAGSDSKI